MTRRETKFIDALYDSCYSKLYYYAASILYDRDFAEEAVQDTFLTACVKIEELKDHPNPEGWLVQTLKYLILNRKRAETSCQNLLQKFADQMQTHSEDSGDIPELPDITRDELRLLKGIYRDGYSTAEMAQKLGITREACKKRLQRFREKLKPYYEEERSDSYD